MLDAGVARMLVVLSATACGAGPAPGPLGVGTGCSGCSGIVTLDPLRGSSFAFEPEPAPAPVANGTCELLSSCQVSARPDADLGSLSPGEVSVFVDDAEAEPPILPDWVEGATAGATATGGEFPAFDLVDIVTVPTIPDFEVAFTEDGDLDFTWEAGSAPLVTIRAVTGPLSVDCWEETRCVVADTGHATLVSDDLSTWGVATGWLGRTEVADAEVAPGAVVEIRATTWTWRSLEGPP